MDILGISGYYHDSAACLVRDGEIIAAVQEERFTRRKHDPGFPYHSIEYCLREGGIQPSQLDCAGFYDKPLLKFERLLETYLTYAPKGLGSFFLAVPQWLGSKLWIRDSIRKVLRKDLPILFALHHESHAASAFYPSPFEEAAILTVDGVGEWTTASIGMGRGREIQLLEEIRFPHSLGLLYSAFTYFTGFKVNSGEYKLMGLAPYGEPRYVDVIRKELIHLEDDGSFRLNLDYFDFCTGKTMTNERFNALFGGPPRKPEDPLTQREMDIARSIQEVTEDAMLRMAYRTWEKTRIHNLCLAGGVALNCVANGRILREGPFKRIWIQPAAGDAGGAIGVALLIWHGYHGKPRDVSSLNGRLDFQKGSYLGPAFSQSEIESYLLQNSLPFERMDSDPSLVEKTASLITKGKVVGWFQGRMEFGPRALGARSILGDPRNPEMQSVMNLKIKYRESFRPFAPAILRHRVADYFNMDTDSPYMLLVAPVREDKRLALSDAQRNAHGTDRINQARSVIPAVTHVDYSARIQTVNSTDHPLFSALLEEFERQTGCPVLINTSFNVRGEPIVCTPQEAYACFMRTEMDALVIGRCILYKSDQPEFAGKGDWKEEFELD